MKHVQIYLATLRGLFLLLPLMLGFGATSAAASVETAAGSQLPTSVQAVLKRLKLDGRGLSVVVHALDEEQAALSFNAQEARNPASAIKLFTTYAALDTLGPAYQWHTAFHIDGELQHGSLKGDLWLKGGGDPFLPIERMWLMVESLRQTGLKKIEGDLIIDTSLFAPIDENPGDFDNQPLRAYNVVPSAMISSFNVNRFIFRPKPGTQGVEVEIQPPLPSLKVSNRLRTKRGSCRGYQRGIALNKGAKNEVILEGSFPKGCKVYSMNRSVMEQNQYTADLFRLLWERSGGTWTGSFRTGSREFSEPAFMEFPSVALAEAVRSINKYSNNVMTRTLFLTLGMEQHGAPATEDKARAAMLEFLASKSIDSSHFVIDNGAGSSRTVRATAHQFAALLRSAWSSPYMPELISSMSIPGQDGTFSRRHVTGGLNGQAHLKSGRLDHVVAMAGIVQAKSGKRYIVTTLHNAHDVHRGAGQAVQDTLLKWVYRESP